MREIKFRVWSNKENKFLTNDNLENFWIRPHDFVTCFMEWRPDFDGEMVFETKKTKFIYQQFTGLKDENGKEIYEGDILKLGNEIGEIHYKENDGGYIFLDDFASLFANRAIIIGNILENPDYKNYQKLFRLP